MSGETQDQVNKAKHNARFNGAGNRFSEDPWCSVPVISASFPAYTFYKDLNQRNVLSEEAWAPLPIEEFIASHTDNGFLYHGTKDKANLISMLRGGFIMSDNNAGTSAALGTGLYTTKTWLWHEAILRKKERC